MGLGGALELIPATCCAVRAKRPYYQVVHYCSIARTSACHKVTYCRLQATGYRSQRRRQRRREPAARGDGGTRGPSVPTISRVLLNGLTGSGRALFLFHSVVRWDGHVASLATSAAVVSASTPYSSAQRTMSARLAPLWASPQVRVCCARTAACRGGSARSASEARAVWAAMTHAAVASAAPACTLKRGADSHGGPLGPAHRPPAQSCGQMSDKIQLVMDGYRPVSSPK